MQTRVSKGNKAMTTQQLVDHVKAIGQAIIDDAEKIAFDADDLSLIGISAIIAPHESVTTVKYQLNRIADPRKDNYGRTEETKSED